MLINLIETTLDTEAVSATENTTEIDLNGAESLSVQTIVTVNTPAAKTFVDADVNVGADTITIASHGLPLGLKGQLTTTGVLPGGLSGATDYFVIVVNANTIKLATSLANAQAGTAVDITSAAGGGTHTFTPTALAGATVTLQKSNDKSNWSNEGSAVAISASGSVWVEKDRPGFRWARLQYTLTAGSYAAVPKVLVKG
jgi:hypothetical protein